MKKLIATLECIQKSLNAPKNQTNKFGGYNYRSCEDILMAVKPLLSGVVIIVTDELIAVGERYYVKATASITDGENTISASSCAREAEVKKGMDEAQITGSASSYARKYALNGLLLIDDNKDADHQDNRNQEPPARQQQPAPQKPAAKPAYDHAAALKWLNESTSIGMAEHRNKQLMERAETPQQKAELTKALNLFTDNAMAAAA